MQCKTPWSMKVVVDWTRDSISFSMALWWRIFMFGPFRWLCCCSWSLSNGPLPMQSYSAWHCLAASQSLNLCPIFGFESDRIGNGHSSPKYSQSLSFSVHFGLLSFHVFLQLKQFLLKYFIETPIDYEVTRCLSRRCLFFLSYSNAQYLRLPHRLALVFCIDHQLVHRLWCPPIHWIQPL